ncbi:MAG: hypothetical protein GY882_11605 [Actinomycetia bacterium]|nr:hypothetical protein [Actinomycetes bacterium]MCP4845814.1 hypothetical protein [Actinomycetes bacterium]
MSTSSEFPLSDLIRTPFVSSFIGDAREADRHVGDRDLRICGWAAWAISSLQQMSGYQSRSYPALVLDGAFYDPKGTGPTVTPHLEVPEWRLALPGGDFPARLALAGNGLDFPYWVKDEVLAVRRGLFNNPQADVRDAADMLFSNRAQLERALADLLDHVAPSWESVERLVVAAEDDFCETVCADFSSDEVAAYFPAGAGMRLSVSFDSRLAERNGRWASRRVGVWQVSGVDAEGERFSFGVITPRLTANSQYRDPLFNARGDSPATLLVRGLLLARICDRHLSGTAVTVDDVDGTVDPGPHFHTVAARPGAKLPEASQESAINFLQVFPGADDAWSHMLAFAERTEMLLTITPEGFSQAHRRALRFLRRGEALERDDVNVLMPLGWRHSKVLRVTYSRLEGE